MDKNYSVTLDFFALTRLNGNRQMFKRLKFRSRKEDTLGKSACICDIRFYHCHKKATIHKYHQETKDEQYKRGSSF
jgi:hypothetical protein